MQIVHDSAKFAACPPPPCGEGLGVGVYLQNNGVLFGRFPRNNLSQAASVSFVSGLPMPSMWQMA